MAKPIQNEEIAAFREHCRVFYAEQLEDGDTAVYWTIESCPMLADSEEWDFDPTDDETHDILELFEAVGDEFEFEEEGHGSFFIAKK